jgi:hypothetical protein
LTGATFFLSPFPSELSSPLSSESPPSEPPSSDPPSLELDSLELDEEDSEDDELELVDDEEDAADDAADDAAEDAAEDAAFATACVTVCVTTAFAGHGVEKIPLTHVVTSPEINCWYVNVLDLFLTMTNTPLFDCIGIETTYVFESQGSM